MKKVLLGFAGGAFGVVVLLVIAAAFLIVVFERSLDAFRWLLGPPGLKLFAFLVLAAVLSHLGEKVRAFLERQFGDLKHWWATRPSRAERARKRLRQQSWDMLKARRWKEHERVERKLRVVEAKCAREFAAYIAHLDKFLEDCRRRRPAAI